MPTYLSTYLPIHPSTHFSIYLLSVYLSIHPFIHPATHLSIHPSLHLSIYLLVLSLWRTLIQGEGKTRPDLSSWHFLLLFFCEEAIIEMIRAIKNSHLISLPTFLLTEEGNLNPLDQGSSEDNPQASVHLPSVFVNKFYWNTAVPICPHIYACFYSAAQPSVVTKAIGLEKPKVFVIWVFTEKKKTC